MTDMTALNSIVKPNSSDFLNNTDNMQILVNDLNSKLKYIHQGGSYQAREQHQKRGKLLVRERIKNLLDIGGFFMELSPMAGEQLYDCEINSAGLITGIGKVNGISVMVIANDATVKGGAYFPVTVKKHCRAQKIAEENFLPCIHLVDSGGAFLPMQDEVFPDYDSFGQIFFNQSRMSAKGIPQIAVVMGPSVAGGAYVAAMSDETIIVKNQGTIYLGGPELVYAATGEVIDAESLGGADVHCKVSGLADHMANDDSHALQMCRELMLHIQNTHYTDNHVQYSSFKDPLYDAYQLFGIVSKDLRQPINAYEIIARLVDGSEFFEFKSLYGKTLVCGFSKIHGFDVGIVANNGILFSESALKGTHFINLCNQRNIPLLFLQNIAGFMVGKHYEHQGIAKDGAKMVTAVSTARVAKFTVIIGGSFGAGNYAMCGRAYNPRFLWIWPNSRISVMGGEVAAKLMTQIKQNTGKFDKSESGQELEELTEKIKERFDYQGKPFYSSARLWDDGIIDPTHTRRYLAIALELANKQRPEPYNSPVFRM